MYDTLLQKVQIHDILTKNLSIQGLVSWLSRNTNLLPPVISIRVVSAS